MGVVLLAACTALVVRTVSRSSAPTLPHVASLAADGHSGATLQVITGTPTLTIGVADLGVTGTLLRVSTPAGQPGAATANGRRGREPGGLPFRGGRLRDHGHAERGRQLAARPGGRHHQDRGRPGRRPGGGHSGHEGLGCHRPDAAAAGRQRHGPARGRGQPAPAQPARRRPRPGERRRGRGRDIARRPRPRRRRRRVGVHDPGLGTGRRRVRRRSDRGRGPHHRDDPGQPSALTRPGPALTRPGPALAPALRRGWRPSGRAGRRTRRRRPASARPASRPR